MGSSTPKKNSKKDSNSKEPAAITTRGSLATTQTNDEENNNNHDENDDNNNNEKQNGKGGTEKQKGKKRKKQFKRMEKLLAKIWENDTDGLFQDDAKRQRHAAPGVCFCLVAIGQKLDQQAYFKPNAGSIRHAWEAFAKDVGGVFNRHIHRKTKRAAAAKEQLEKVKALLGAINVSLAQLAAEHVPEDAKTLSNGSNHESSGGNVSSSTRKRKAAAAANDDDQEEDENDDENTIRNGTTPPATSALAERSKNKKKKANKNSELAEREERSLEQLLAFLQERGGTRQLLEGFSARVTRKGGTAAGGGRFDVNFYNEQGRRFRSMLEVGRFFKLVKENETTTSTTRYGGGGGRGGLVARRAAGSRETEAEKKRLRKELDRLRKAHQRATKTLDDFITEEKESRFPIDDQLLMVVDHDLNHQDNKTDDSNNNKATTATSSSSSSSKPMVTRATCAAARTKDIVGFTGVPEHCIPDTIMAWDFLCTFQRALSLSPISLDDFASALTYTPPEGQIGDDVAAPPVYIAEAHLALVKFLLQDDYSNDWWWSTLETDEAVNADDETLDKDQEGKPAIRIDFAALINEEEDPLITNSWLASLIGVSTNNEVKGSEAIKTAIQTALKVVANKYVHAYLRTVLTGFKILGVKFMKQSIIFLVRSVTEARPDLGDRPVRQDAIQKVKDKVIEEATKAIESLPLTAPEVKTEDVHSDLEYDEESDESDDEGDAKQNSSKATSEEMTSPNRKIPNQAADDGSKPASAIPSRPPPSLVDLLLPPSKPPHSAEFINAFTWAHMVGATAKRILHRKKRLWNEVDDYLRATREMPPITVAERREREAIVTSRVLTECAQRKEDDPLEKAIEHLSGGEKYLNLSIIERLCILRLLIEASYDAGKLYDVVNGNIKQRTSAMKALDNEQRRAKREARDKAAADEGAAREQLALEAKERFLEEKREEVRKLNEKSKALTEDIMESLTDEDILAFDDDIKADYDELPTPDSFNKTQVKEMVERMREEAAFDTDALRVLTMDELLEREKRQLEEMEGQLLGFGGEDSLLDPNLDRETVRSIERLQRDIAKMKEQVEKLPELRARAVEQLQESIADGTIKVLRGAITAAKKAKLTGPDDETGGVWALDLMRDAALEFENAKQNKRVLDAQRDLVAKRNKCFIRTEPLGRDRFGNRFWTFDDDGDGHVWVETEYLIPGQNGASTTPPRGFLELTKEPAEIIAGAENPMEPDLMSGLEPHKDEFYLFTRKEFHSAGFTSAIVNNHWGCHASEESLRAVIRTLDSKGRRENELKTGLKEALEQSLGNAEKGENSKEQPALPAAGETAGENVESNEAGNHQVQASGDEEKVLEAKNSALKAATDGAVLPYEVFPEALEDLTTGIGQLVRVRLAVEDIQERANDKPVARYESGAVTGWKTQPQELQVFPKDEDAMEESDEEENTEPKMETTEVPLWRVATDRGHIVWLTASELIESVCRYFKYKNGKGYFESDAAYIAYRNSLGRYCGKAADAPYACSPNYFARLMVRREGDIYPKLKMRTYDNSWGGKSGARALWMNSMKDYAYDFNTVKQGLLTLENAFFELTGEFQGYENANEEIPDVKVIMDDPVARDDIELETEKSALGLWNSPKSRAVFLEIVSTCKTTGILALALDQLCRNASKFLQAHKQTKEKAQTFTEEDDEQPTTSRRSRRMNAWQQKQKQQVNYAESDEEDFEPLATRRPRRAAAWQPKQKVSYEDDDDDYY